MYGASRGDPSSTRTRRSPLAALPAQDIRNPRRNHPLRTRTSCPVNDYTKGHVMRNPLLLAAGAASILLAVPAYSQSADRPFLHPLFTDNMVLQRDQSDAIWGWTTPGSTVTVKLDGKATTAVAGADGKWLAHLPSTKAGGPHTIDVTGPESVTLKNVLFGDVWICSGQSNMQFGVQNLVDGGKDEIADADHPNIRLFMAPDVSSPTPLDLVKGSWSVCSPETIVKDGWGGFSAVGYFFGRDLERDIHVPIGLLETTWGGTPVVV